MSNHPVPPCPFPARPAALIAATLVLQTLLLAACELPPLTRERLFGVRDAAPAVEAAPPQDVEQPVDTSQPQPDLAPDGGPSGCQPQSQDGLVSGIVVDACTKAALTAYVGVGGKHQCSFADKGSFHFAGLPVGCRLSLTAGQRGYRPFVEELVIPSEGLSALRIELEPQAGCSTPVTGELTCSCTSQACAP